MTVVAFWNVNMGNGADLNGRQRRKTFRDWVQWATPDVLILEELSDTLLPGRTGVPAAHDGIAAGSDIAAIAGMTYVGHVETQQRGTHTQSTKNLIALRHNGLLNGQSIQARALQMRSSSGLETAAMMRFSQRAAASGVRGRTATGLHVQPRMCLKLTRVPSILGGSFELIGVHAKSGGGGRGRQAVAWARDYARSARDAVIGGDFNYDFDPSLNGLDTAGVAPLLHGGAAATFTQWAKGAGYHPAHLLPAIGLPAFQQPTFTVQSHGVIDYVIHNTLRMVTALNSVPVPALGLAAADSLWRNILRDFDHMPVSYNVI